MLSRGTSRRLAIGLVAVFALAPLTLSQSAAAERTLGPRSFGLGAKYGVADLPGGSLRNGLEGLPAPAQQRAMGWLKSFHFSELDVPYLRVDQAGGVFYEDPERNGAAGPGDSDFTFQQGGTDEAEVQAISEEKVFTLHSKPGAARVVHLDMDGAVVSGTRWNVSTADTLYMRPYDTDGDESSFSSSELQVIAEVWKRIAEDYAPFDIDVTTEQPASYGPNVGHILVTRKADENGTSIYNCSCGGVAYVGVWGRSNYTYYQPALVFLDGVGGAHNITEAASHELGHNLNLSHDGSNTVSYYRGHGSGWTDWAPIMGAGYSGQVTQWSKGEYQDANNKQDDLAIIAGYLGYRGDDHANSDFALATPLSLTGDTDITATNPVSDPDNLETANKGVIENRNDVDLFAMEVGDGTIDLTVTPAWVESFASASRRGTNLDVRARLFAADGSLLQESNPSDNTFARITLDVDAGRFILAVDGVGAGNPLNTGYSDYASLGQYFINGTVPEGAPKVLTALEISGPASIDEDSSGGFAATATWDDSSKSSVAASWSENSPYSSISSGGVLTTAMVTADSQVTVSASYSVGGVTKQASKTVTIRDIKKLLVGLTISGPATLDEGNSASYSATAAWDDGSSSSVTPSWSETASFTTIDTNGLLTAGSLIGDQKVTVKASYSAGGVTKSAEKSVTVLDKIKGLSTLQIAGASSLEEEDATSYSATANWDDGLSSAVSAVWSEDSVHASIDGNGLLQADRVTANEPLTVTASFTSNGVTKKANKAVTILDVRKALAGLSISGPGRVPEKGKATFQATALWDDGSESDVTAAWSLDGDSASVNGQGLLSARRVIGNQALTLRARFTSDGTTEKATRAITVTDRARNDFDGDGDSDIFWHHTENGRNRLWVMAAGAQEAAEPVKPLKNFLWEVVGLGDLTGDGMSDVLWRRQDNGSNRLWAMQGASRLSDAFLPKLPGKGWRLAGLSDFDGDGTSDILWHNGTSLANQLWLMDGAERETIVDLPTYPASWVIAGLGDLNGDSQADIVWRNPATGANRLWIMNGGSRKSTRALPTFQGNEWQVAGLGDFDGDGRADIVWRNMTTGANRLWLMKGAAIKVKGTLPKLSAAQWILVGSGDHDGDGAADLLWRNSASGANRLWLMEGLTRSAVVVLPRQGGDLWQIQR